MRKLGLAVLLVAGAAWAEQRTITLREAVDLALKQNPDIALARLDETKAGAAIRVMRDPFVPKIAVGSGLAYTSGIPMSIEGSTPSIIQAQASQSIINRQQTNLVAEARENARGAAIDTAAKREAVVLRTALVYLDAERTTRMAETARKQVDSLQRVAETVRLRVNDGRELPIEVKRAELNLARARQRQQALESDQRYSGSLLASLLGLDTNQEIRVAVEDRAPAPLAAGEEACAEAALASSKEVRRLESALTAKGFEVRADRSAKLPRLELVAQYALLGRYNNYQEFFAKFQRHNGEIGVSFQVPLFAGIAADAMAVQAESESAKLRLELQAARNRIAMDARRLYQQAKNAESAQDVARLDLEVTRDQLSVLLAQMEEGRASLKQVEEARLAEDDKWLAFVESSYAVETARLNLLHQTGELLAALRP